MSNKEGSLRSDTLLRLGTLGNTIARKRKHANAATAIQKKVIRQPTCNPITRPKGNPTIIAIDVPVIIKPNAIERRPSGATRTARGETTDQNMACAQATPTRETINI